jgi:hypothetical protein
MGVRSSHSSKFGVQSVLFYHCALMFFLIDVLLCYLGCHDFGVPYNCHGLVFLLITMFLVFLFINMVLCPNLSWCCVLQLSWLYLSFAFFEILLFHSFSMHIIIKKQQPYYSTHSCLLPRLCMLSNLLLKSCFASKIHALVPLWICLQAFLKFLVNPSPTFFITNY